MLNLKLITILVCNYIPDIHLSNTLPLVNHDNVDIICIPISILNLKLITIIFIIVITFYFRYSIIYFVALVIMIML